MSDSPPWLQFLPHGLSPTGANDSLRIRSSIRLWSSFPNICSLVLLLTLFSQYSLILVSEPLHLLSESTYLSLPVRSTDMYYLVAGMHSGK